MTENKENMITKRQAATEVHKYAKTQETLTIVNLVAAFLIALGFQLSYMFGSFAVILAASYNAYFLWKARGTLAYLKEKYF